MKKNSVTFHQVGSKRMLVLVTAFMLMVVSCSKSNEDGGAVSPVEPSSTTDVRGSIKSDVRWTKDNVYRLRGYVYVEPGVTLTIDPGTKIVSNSDSAGVLVIYKGAQIKAEGTASKPIVFTSAESSPKPGDLGGLVLVGQATGNGNHSNLEGGVDDAHKDFGGNNDADNSGILQYVRIEYAGKAVNPDDEVNALSLYSVGSGTTIDHIQVVRGLDDGYEFFGGSVNCKYLIAYNCADDDFDMDDGFHGKIQYGLSIKDPDFTDNKGTSGDLSNNFEADNTNGKIPFNTTPVTSPVLSNFTAIGPNNAAGTSTDFGYGMRFRRGAKVTLANSIVLGSQKGGLIIEDDWTQRLYKNGEAKFYNSLICAVTKPFLVLGKDSTILNTAVLASITMGSNRSELLGSAADAGLRDPFNPVMPDLQPKQGAKALTKKGKFDVNGLDNGFFDKTDYIGAFEGNNDWTSGWAVWGR